MQKNRNQHYAPFSETVGQEGLLEWRSGFKVGYLHATSFTSQTTEEEVELYKELLGHLSCELVIMQYIWCSIALEAILSKLPQSQ